ncbi:MAG: hypothetical protein OES24_22360 [Acidimicrobiia bacterium]|nr:hypothetical protein [Acidimicrobiia bacterium]
MSDNELTILSWNLAMFERSADAPTYWGQSDVEAAVRETLLAVKPDLVAYQELPGLVPFVETHDMIRSNPRSHSGNLATLVAHRLMASKPEAITVRGTGLLAVFPDRDLTVANVHLAPGRGSAEQRREQLRVVLQASPTERIVVIGDTNTRVDEEDAFADLGLEAPRPPGPTWDGHRNRFRGDSGAFRAYFTRAFTSGSVSIIDQRILDEPLDVDGQRFHLSDHFPLHVTVGW